MNRRCKTYAAYKAIKILLTKEEFLAWAVPAIEKFLEKYPGESPSIDRYPDPDGHYRFGNIRIISARLNELTRRIFGKNAHLLPAKQKQTLLAQLISKQADNLELSFDDVSFVCKNVLEHKRQEAVLAPPADFNL